MRILLSNKYYYAKGGDCVYSIELEKLLRSNGHEVAFFAMQHEKNLPSEYSRYFPSEIDYTKRTINDLIKKLFRPFYSRETVTKFRALLNDFKPDVLHVNNIHSYLSPVIVREASRKNIPVIWTLHDYKLICPAYLCYRKDTICELCFKRKINVVTHRCIKRSLIASAIAFFEALQWNRKKLQGYTDAFICPSQFMRIKMIEAGFNPDQLIVLNNFIDDKRIENKVSQKEDYFCYVGRLSFEKGVETLLKAMASFPQYRLKIIGTGPEEKRLKDKYSHKNIEFIGYMKWDDLKEIVKKALFIVVPSEWYENNPLSIIESFSLGTSVIGADIGGIPELIQQNINGLLFESGNCLDLQEKIKLYQGDLKNNINNSAIVDMAKERFSSENYYKKIINAYSRVIDMKTSKC